MTTNTDKASDKLVEMALKAAFEKGWCAAAQWAQRDDLRHDTGSIAYAGQRDAILAGCASGLRSAILADAAKDVQVVAWSVTCDGEHVNNIHTSEIEANRGKRNLDRDFPDHTREVVPLVPASTLAAAQALNAELVARVIAWTRLYDRAINEANGLTNYVEDRPELRSAERRMDVISADARALKDAAIAARNGT
ncbi:MAG: hypothetical protein LCH79_15480 [Proteobacteria bacterium]|nr:hypothetical protein [Pseudomonadota bacterium]